MNPRATLPTAILALLAATVPMRAQSQPAPPKTPTASLTITARPIERPVLEFALMFRADEMTKGNAALKYAEAIQEIPQSIGKGPFTAEDHEAMDKLRTVSLATLDEKNARPYLLAFTSSFVRAEAGARRDTFDLQTDLREKGFRAQLPSLGKYRQIANMLAVAIRLDIKNHRWTEARLKLATGFGMARHLGGSETLIEGLVGASIAAVMNKCIEDWISENGPNLYWDLVNMPRPFIDLRRAWAHERATAIFSFPELRNMRDGKYSRDNWSALFSYFDEIVGAYSGGDGPIGTKTAPWKIQLFAATYGAVNYPMAKDFLIKRGTPRDAVEKMPVAEALSRHFIRSYDEAADEMFKATGLPPHQAASIALGADKELRQAPFSEVNPHARMFLPAVSAGIVIPGRIDRQIDMLRTVEALRAHIAEKKQFPEKLEDLALPIPTDVITGKPFEYERTATTATIRSTNTTNPREGAIINLTLSP